MTPTNENANLKPDDPEQSKRFEDTARQLEAEKNAKSFEKALRIVKSPRREADPARPTVKRFSS